MRKTRIGVFSLFVVLLLLVGVVAYASSSFSFSNLSPANNSTIYSPNTTVKADVRSSYDITAARVLVNGVIYSAKFTPYTSNKHGEVRSSVNGLKDGQQQVELMVRDASGTIGKTTWIFNVAVSPTISQVYPANNSSHSTIDVIKANIVDANDVLEKTNIQMKLNGVLVQGFTYDLTTGNLSYTPTNLIPGTNTVILTATDNSNNSRSVTWNFTITNSPPVFSNMTPIGTVAVGNPELKVDIASASDILKDSVKMFINSQQVPAKFTYRTYYNQSYQLVTDYTKGTLVYKPEALPKGVHSVLVTATNKAGNSAQTENWSIEVNALPKILEISPAPSHVSVTRPIVDIDLYSNDELTDVQLAVQYGVYAPQTVKLTKTVLGTYTTRYSYQTIEPWEMDTTVLLQLKATNASGTLTKDWKYTVSRYPDMSVSNTSCALCHNTVEIKKQQCGSCHASSINSWQSKCFTCHLTGPPPKNHHSYSTYPHDVSADHTLGLSDLVACRNCHSQTLTRTHNLNSLTCASCHDNKPVVSTASLIDALNLFKRGRILWTVSGVNRRIDDNKRCFTCHTGAQTVTRHMEHRVSHTGACVECHGTGMTTTGAGITGHQDDCLSCHASTNPSVRQAIELQKNSCIDCHTSPHGVYMAALRDDIPLYSGNGVTWSIPQDASIWADDGWLPPELNDLASKVVFSSRSVVDAATIRDYYTVAMESAGWTQIGSTYGVSADYFQLKYQKSKRYAVIWYYKGDVPDEPGTNAEGARLQVAYH